MYADSVTTGAGLRAEHGSSTRLQTPHTLRTGLEVSAAGLPGEEYVGRDEDSLCDFFPIRSLHPSSLRGPSQSVREAGYHIVGTR